MNWSSVFKGKPKSKVLAKTDDRKLDSNQYYFLMSFRFNKSKPEEFGLVKNPDDTNVFFNPEDKSIWVKEELYDLGWGEENGFVRLPQLDFEDLWFLLTHSKIEENKYGAATHIIKKYSQELQVKLIEIVSNSDYPISKELKQCFRILELEEPYNRSNIVGKSVQEINEDYKTWKNISERISKILSEK